MALSPDADIVFRTIYAVLIAVNIAGNVLVCLAVYRFSFMRSTMNYLIVHVAICDILSGLFLTPKAVLLGLYEHPGGLLGDFLCKFLTSGQLGWVSGSASMYTLVAIAWERYKAIVKPHSPRFSNKQVKRAIMISWLVAVLISVPELVASGYNSRTQSCDWMWMGRWDSLLDSTVWLIGVGLAPSMIIATLYSKVICSLWCRGNSVENVTQRSLLKSRKRVTLSVILVTAILFVCWLPMSLKYIILSYLNDGNSIVEYVRVIFPIFDPISWILVLLNAAVNPFIYALRDVRFRRCMIKLISGNEQNRDNNAPENIHN